MNDATLQNLKEQTLFVRAWVLNEVCNTPLAEGLEGLCLDFPSLEKHFQELGAHHAAGKNLEEYFRANSPPFHPLTAVMVSVGQATGTLPTCLAILRDYLDDEIRLRERGAEQSQLKAWQFYAGLYTVFTAGLPFPDSLNEANLYSGFLPEEVMTEIIANTPPYISDEAKRMQQAIKKIHLSFAAHLMKDHGVSEEEIPTYLKEDSQPGELVEIGKFHKSEAPTSSAPFTDSLAKYPQYFPKFVVGTIRFGEEGGILDTVIKRVVEFYGKKAELF